VQIHDLLQYINVKDPGSYNKLPVRFVIGWIPEYEVLTWDDMMPDVVQQIRADSVSG